jgi:hypothetical protein
MNEKPESGPITIQKPTIGRVVLFTAFRGHEQKATDEYAGIIVKVHEGGVVDLVTFGPFSVYHNNGVPHDAAGGAQGWRYPEITRETIEV